VKKRLRQLLQARTALCFTHVLLRQLFTLKLDRNESQYARKKLFTTSGDAGAPKTVSQIRRSKPQTRALNVKLGLARLAFERHWRKPNLNPGP